MKLKYLVLIFPLLLASSCQKADKYFDGIYITGTDTRSVLRYYVDEGEQLTIPVSASASSRTDEPVEVIFAVDFSLVEEYNSRFGAEAIALPKEAFSLSGTTVVIQAGEYVSQTVNIEIDDVSNLTEAQQYVVPCKIERIVGDYDLIPGSDVVFVSVTRILNTQSTRVTSSNNFAVEFPQTDRYENCTQFTMEGRFYGTYSDLATLIGAEGIFMIRLGGGSGAYGMQLLTKGDIYFMNVERFWTNNTWYHIAAVFDGASSFLYANGELIASLGTPIGMLDLTRNTQWNAPHPDFRDGGALGVAGGYKSSPRPLNGYVSEVRMWTTARSAEQIANNMCDLNDPTRQEGLAGYWKFDGTDILQEGDDGYVAGYTRIKDQSGQGNHLWRVQTTSTSQSFLDIKCPSTW
ncbi:MAG: DUF1735 and LamG domain-containing protein [Rikenellaceae bacterium]|nr:DUF1735 and LamG domain-containing protein [Rikenellaceae bacterium]